MPLDFISFLLLVGGIGSGVCHIMAVSAPRNKFLASDGACFVRLGRKECLGVGQGVLLYLV